MSPAVEVFPAWLLLQRATSLPAHKRLLPLGQSDMYGFSLISLSSALAAGAGIGGGGMLVPILILIVGFEPHDATPLSNVAILGGSLANLYSNAPRRHPIRDKPLISYEVALLMEPMTMLGALGGCVLNKIFPGWLISVLLVAVLGLTAIRTLKKASSLWERESTAAASPYFEKEVVLDDEDTILGSGSVPLLSDNRLIPPALPLAGKSEFSFSSMLRAETWNLSFAKDPWRSQSLDDKDVLDGEVAMAVNQAVQEKEERRQMRILERSPNLTDIMTLVILLIVCFVLSLFRGHFGESLSYVKCGSITYWLLFAAEFLIIVIVSLWARARLMKRHARRMACQYKFVEGDVRWNARNTQVYPMLCIVAGMCAGMFGIGGGIVKGPLMLEMGMIPAVSSATASYMIIYTSATAALSYAIAGQVEPTYAVALFIVGFLSTLIGQAVLNALLKRVRKQSVIVFLIGVIIAISAFAMAVVGGYNFYHTWRRGRSQGFLPLCLS